MRLSAIGALGALFLVLFAGEAAAERRVALVVGNANYHHVSPLNDPVNDARLMADALRKLGFALVGDAALTDLDTARLDSAIRDFGHQVVGADVALFYYAGHAIQLRGTNYLVPVNASPAREADVDFQMADIALVLHQMEGSGTRLNLVILDACRDNPFSGRGLRSGASGLAQMTAPEATLMSYATQPGHVARDGGDGESLFTKALAETIRRQGLELLDVFNEVGLAVKRATGDAQQPWVSSSSIAGTFYFAAPDQAAPAGSAAQGEVVAAEPPAQDKSRETAAIGPRERAVLYDEETTNPKGKQCVGSVVWRTEPVEATVGAPADIAVRADIEIPTPKLKVTLSLRKNTDAALPASHTVELKFDLPPDVSGGGVAKLPGILMKSNEQARGAPLAGLAVKVTDGFFLLGLSNVDADRTRNLELLRERSWFDLPIVYNNQRRAILAIEKGPSGERAFEAALSGVGTGAGCRDSQPAAIGECHAASRWAASRHAAPRCA